VNPVSPHTISLDGYTLRRFVPTDAPAIVRLVRAIYGDSYYPTDLYDPEKIIYLNETGKLVSIVTLDSAGQVVGHYALERPDMGPVAEASDAIVLPEHRHHHLMEQMRILLRAEALREGLAGLVGYPVTNHLFSQKAEEHFGSFPCGVALGLWPQSFHNMPEALPQRMSFVIYFKYLQPHREVVHVDTHHREITSRIYQQYGITVQHREGSPPKGQGVIDVRVEEPVQTGTIRVRRVGIDSIAAIRHARQDLCASRAVKAITLELPLTQPGTLEVLVAAEEDGFFFSGLGPRFAHDGDYLLLQYVDEDLDLSLVQVDGPFANDLFTYVARERQRVQESSGIRKNSV
jgi:hypothetical protein